jgi:hypothetical protein
MLHLYLETYKITYKVKLKLYKLCNKVKLKLAKIGSKMQPKVVVLLPFVVLKCNIIATSGSKVYRNPRKNIQVSKA